MLDAPTSPGAGHASPILSNALLSRLYLSGYRLALVHELNNPGGLSHHSNLSRRLCPQARVIVTGNTLQTALDLYPPGADSVFIPRIHSAKRVAGIIAESIHGRLDDHREMEMAHLLERREVLG